MTVLSGKVQSLDGVEKFFSYNDVQDAVQELKLRLKSYYKNRLLMSVSRDVINIINASFHDVTNMITGEFKDYVKKKGDES